MAVQFRDGEARSFFFPYGDGREREGKYGPQYQYSIKEGGEADTLFASEALHKMLQDAGVDKNVTLIVTRLPGEGTSKVWSVEEYRPSKKGQSSGGTQAPSPQDRDERPAPARNEEYAPAPGRGPKETFAGRRALLSKCLVSVLEDLGATNMAFTSDNVCSLASTLFIDCQRNGVRADDEPPQHDPPPQEPPPQGDFLDFPPSDLGERLQSLDRQLDEAFPDIRNATSAEEEAQDEYNLVISQIETQLAKRTPHEQKAYGAVLQQLDGPEQLAEARKLLILLLKPKPLNR